MKNNPSPAILWLLLTSVCLVFIIYGLKLAIKRTGWQKDQGKKIFSITVIALLVWAGLLALLSLRGFFSDFSRMPPRPPLAILIPLPFVLVIAFSKKGSQLLSSVPPQWLVFMQSFRIFVEVLLLLGFLTNKLPVQMTFEGRNFDMLTGILALPVGYFCFVKKSWSTRIALAFNIAGLLLLLNILIIAMLSMPTPIRYFMNEPASTVVGEFPYIYLPGVLVPLAYTLHIFSLRQLFLQKKGLRLKA